MLVVVLAGMLTLTGLEAGPRPTLQRGNAVDEAARDAVRCVAGDPEPGTYTIVVMLIAERDGLAVPGLVREIRRGVARLDQARSGDRGLTAATFALAARAEVGDDPAAAEAHLATAAQLIEQAGPGAGSPAMVLGATELARTAREFGDPRAEKWLHQAVIWSGSGRGGASPAVRALAEAELTGLPLLPAAGPPPHCAYDRAAGLSLSALHRPTGETSITAALLSAVSPRRS